jgi:hypothetical protein
MLEDFTRRHDIDILFLQEVNITAAMNRLENVTHHNIGISVRGTAVVTRKELLSPSYPNYRQDLQSQLNTEGPG